MATLTAAERQKEMEHGLAFFRRYVKANKVLYIMTLRKTARARYVRVFIVSAAYSMGSHKPGIQDITYSVAKLLSLSSHPHCGYVTVRVPFMGNDKTWDELTAWINRAVFGDMTMYYYEGTDL